MCTELAWAVDVMVARTKRIYILMIRLTKLFPFTSARYFLKEIKKKTCSPYFYRVLVESYKYTDANAAIWLAELLVYYQPLEYR